MSTHRLPASLLPRLGSAILTCLTLIAFAAAADWRLALLAHLRPQLALGLFVTLMILLLYREWRTALVTALTLGVNLSFFVPLWIGTPTPTEAATLSISHINLDYDKVDALDAMAAGGSDIVFLQELTPISSEEALVRMPNYQVVIEEPAWTTGGSGMWIREDWEGAVVSAEFIMLTGDPTRPLLQTTLQLAGQPITILSLHVIRPRSVWTNLTLETAYQQVGEWANAQQAQGHQVIIIGDFNSTPWAHPFRQLLRDAMLINGQTGFGIRNTWPAVLPNMLRLPIDHVVHSTGLQTIEHHIGASVGSDHLPMTVRIQLDP